MFSYLNVKIKSDDVLQDSYDIDMLIRVMKANHVKYDIHSPFTIVFPVLGIQDLGELSTLDDGITVRTIDLYTEYTTVTPDEVARSNQWYLEWTGEVHHQNLVLILDYFRNNCHDDLFTKTNEEYELYPDNQKGGPLFFILMIGNLLSNTREAAKSLEMKIINYKLREQKGEDVSVAVSHLRGALNRLIHIKQYKNNNELHREFFADMYSKLLKVFQTSSVTEFNEIFAQYARQEELNMLMKTTGTIIPTPKFEVLFKMAETKYQEMLERDVWTGLNNSGTESIFFLTGKRKCFNCLGEDHAVDKCPKPKDQARIAANKKLFFEAIKKKQQDEKSKGKGNGKSNNPKPRNGKFSPPTEAEKNRRLIDGKPMYFLTRTKKK